MAIRSGVAKYGREDLQLACLLDELVSRLEKTSGGTPSVGNYSLVFDETFHVRSQAGINGLEHSHCTCLSREAGVHRQRSRHAGRCLQ
jgi:hypothetical protein